MDKILLITSILLLFANSTKAQNPKELKTRIIFSSEGLCKSIWSTDCNQTTLKFKENGKVKLVILDDENSKNKSYGSWEKSDDEIIVNIDSASGKNEVLKYKIVNTDFFDGKYVTGQLLNTETNCLYKNNN